MTSAATARDAVRPAGPDAAPPATTAKSKRSYLHHLDLIRATTFGLVIFIHVLTQTTDEVNSIGVTTTGLLLHFTRNTFFALTGFVLAYQYFDRADFSTWSFWRRRIKLVLYPYVIFTAIYFTVKILLPQGRLSTDVHDFGGYLWGGLTGSSSLRDFPSSVSGTFKEFAWNLGWGLGGGGFHMYFLFVMVQVYLLFPLVLWLLQVTKGYHAVVLGASLALQFVIAYTITHWLPTSSPWWHHYVVFIPYQFFLMYGAIAAVHRDAIARAVTGENARYVGIGLAAALAVAVYVTKVPVPFMNKGQNRTADQDAAEAKKNKDWDPNAPLYGKNPVRPAPAASGAVSGTPEAAAPAASAPRAGASAPATAKQEVKPAVTGDPLGDLAKAKSAG